MSYRWVETDEVEVEIEGSTEEAVFTDALRALVELVGDGPAGERVSREITIEAPERGLLLAQWLDELVYLAETEDLVPEEVERIDLSDGRLDAVVRCHRGVVRTPVKGVTYHRLAFGRGGRGFRARVVLDV